MHTRFMSKVKFSNGCWEWTGYLTKSGYGKVSVDGYKWLAHRYAYQQWNGPLIDGLVIMHECDNKKCVRPNHLTQGTTAKNNADAHARGLINKKGIANSSAKLSEEEVYQIRQLLNIGMPHTVLAKKFGISTRSVWNIAHFKTWTHLPVHGVTVEGIDETWETLPIVGPRQSD